MSNSSRKRQDKRTGSRTLLWVLPVTKCNQPLSPHTKNTIGPVSEENKYLHYTKVSTSTISISHTTTNQFSLDCLTSSECNRPPKLGKVASFNNFS
ncbi:hypothetical protein RRG08_054173 [Elysia crispata]|uniref:Uncharacterized protein n=1 Tax=Elysia crispata TaxID=231223 RepID=A0AAE1A2K2_9GAST|nr:hypothetical protein RRG08_054173 [Elysia crispata]